MQDPFEQLKLMKTARRDEREDLQAISDANIGTAAASILAFNEMRAADMLFNADPNAPVDVPVPADVVAGAVGGGISGALDAVRPTQPEKEFQL